MNRESYLERLVRSSLNGNLPVLFFTLSLLLGIFALEFTSREEEPQIVVPMVDVLVSSPGLSAKQVERQVTIPLEKLLAQIPGVENVYSSSVSGQTSVTLRFYVGEDREKSILNTYNKLYSNQNKIPAVVTDWIVQPVEVDDVPIVVLALWSENEKLYSDFELRRVADEISTYIQAIPDTSEVNVTGGRPRTIRVLPLPESLAARKSTTADIVSALQLSNVLLQAGYRAFGQESVLLESGDFIRDVHELKQMVINVIDGRPVFLQDVAEIIDGPAEPVSYSWIDFSSRHPVFKARSDVNSQTDNFPAVTISIAKQRGSNAVNVASDVHQLIKKLKKELLPASIHVETLRDYGATANEKVSNLSYSLAFAVVTVVVFIAIFLGWRPALVVGLAVPVSYGVTLALDMALGYTINRVTLFALILSLGLLVDDPITGVDNIERFIKKPKGSLKDKIVAAIAEIKRPLVMSTVTIILAFIPLAFISGMMGPYMAPMAFNVPVSVITSTLVAFLVTPWLASKFLKVPDTVVSDTADLEKNNLQGEKLKYPDKEKQAGFYRTLLTPLLNDKRKAKNVLWVVLLLFIAAAMLPVFRLVPLKLLPFDNKNEIQIIIDMPESSSLEKTAAIAKRASQKIRRINEVLAVTSYVGQPSPMDFNGMVRRYYQRHFPYMADLRITLIDKSEREHQSHGIVLRLRKLLAPLNVNGISLKVVEVPPGPPVLSTLVAEVYGSTFTSYEKLQQSALLLQQRLQREAFVTEVDSTVEADSYRMRFITDKTKAALSGISTEDINQALLIANQGMVASHLPLEREAKPLPIKLRLPLTERSSMNDLARLQVKGRTGIVSQSSALGLDVAPQVLVALGELGRFERQLADKSIQRKDLKPVVYVMAELSGRTPAEVIADVSGDQGNGEQGKSQGKVSDWQTRNFMGLLTGNSAVGDGWQLPEDINIVWTGEGEWKITADVFRDMGIAFIFALIGIFIVLKIQTNSSALALIIMSAIPLTIIGIMPGFWMLNQFGEREIAGAPEPVLFTATAMIGMIALAGIVVRNSLILVEFIGQAREKGMALNEALIQAGTVRMRPVLLTAGTTMLGNLVIMLDPVFSGLAIAIISGIIASTLFSLLVVPVVYALVSGEHRDSQEPLRNKIHHTHSVGKATKNGEPSSDG